MCRLFGFKSILLSKVHASLVDADNALMVQSEAHPDGWGVAYYHAGAPHIIRSVSTAVDDSLFRKVSGLVSSQTVIAHLRKATLGELTILNTHPFQYGPWVFAHNGNVKNFAAFRDRLREEVDSGLQRFILGETDSELLFFLLLTHIGRLVPLDSYQVDAAQLIQATRDCVAQVCRIVGPFSAVDAAPPSETFLSFIISNGATMLAHQGGKKLFYSTYKKLCSERETCPSYSRECESATVSGRINHLVLSSEPLSGENIWLEMPVGSMVATDASMKLCLA